MNTNEQIVEATPSKDTPYGPWLFASHNKGGNIPVKRNQAFNSNLSSGGLSGVNDKGEGYSQKDLAKYSEIGKACQQPRMIGDNEFRGKSGPKTVKQRKNRQGT
ncbi:hypothetical protein ACOSP7_002210 [Xanthoceras sorbifolium]